METRGELRGGRFLSGFGGEQFALPEAVESLRELRRRPESSDEVTVAAADPMNLVGIVVPGERLAAVPGKVVTFVNGAVAGAQLLPPTSNADLLALGEVDFPRLFPAAPDVLKQSGMERAGA